MHKFVPFDDALAVHGPTSPGAGSPSASGQASLPQVSAQERTLRLAQMRFFNEYPIPSWIRAILSNFAFYPGFDVGRTSNLRSKPAEIKPLTMLSSSGDNLGTVLHELLTRHDYRSSAEALRDFLKSAYPSFEEVSAETSYGAPPSVLVRLRESGMSRPMELWDISDGMLRFLCLAAALLNPAPPPFIALDEPEVGFHPRLLPIVADMIKMASERTQVLVTTHSPELLDRFDLNDTAVIAREGAHAVWRRPGKRETLHKMLEGVVGDSLGSLHKSGELEAVE
jgi:predicted ATPase